MRISIITPSIQRPSLRACCLSVDTQIGPVEWEHLVCFDCAETDIDSDLMFSLAHPRRRFFSTGQKFGHYGNQARRRAWSVATGDYCVFVDDDNTLARFDALADISHHLESAGLPAWALFPIHRHGHSFLFDPPGMCRTDSANMVVLREITSWPDTEMREADGLLAEDLLSRYPYSAFPDVQPVILMERSSNGE